MVRDVSGRRSQQSGLGARINDLWGFRLEGSRLDEEHHDLSACDGR